MINAAKIQIKLFQTNYFRFILKISFVEGILRLFLSAGVQTACLMSYHPFGVPACQNKVLEGRHISKQAT